MKQCKTYNESDSNINQNIKNIMCDEIFTLELWYQHCAVAVETTFKTLFSNKAITLLSTQVLPRMPAHRAAILVHTFLSAASRSTFPQLLLTLLRSFLKVLLHVIFGLPLFLLPRRSCHFISTFAGQSSDILRMWPANLTLCSVTISCRRRDCALLITLSFVI